jgi:sugar (pentulose or hexulose) kinase
MDTILGIDVGTSSLKAFLFNDQLKPLADSRVEYPTRYPAPGRAEQDPETWYGALTRAVRDLLDKSNQPPGRVAGMAIAGMSSLALPVDNQGQALAPGMIWLDRRARVQSDFIHQHCHERLLTISGNRSDPSNFAPKVMWLRDNEPEIYHKSRYFLHCNAYLVHKLTGVFSLDISQGGLTQLCDIRTGEYSDELIKACGLAGDKFPGIYNCNELVGTVSRTAAAETGLTEGTPVVAGCMDNVAAILGLKLLKSGEAYISAGTATNIGVVLDAPVFDGRGLLYRHGVQGKWLLNGGVDYGSAGLNWFRNLLETDFETLTKLASETVPGRYPLLFLPYMTAQRAPLWNEDVSGAWIGLTPKADRKHMVKSIMEGAALGARHAFSELIGRLPESLSLTGGPTVNPQWVQIFCNATASKIVSRSDADVTCLGAAVLAGVGVSLFPSFEAAMDRAPQGKRYDPEPEQISYYNELYDLYLKTYANLDWTFQQLSRLQKKYGGAS